jgi:hypothetical protein
MDELIRAICRNCGNKIVKYPEDPGQRITFWHHLGLHTPMTPDMEICSRAEPEPEPTEG